MIEPAVSQESQSANPLLWAVKTYLDLVSKTTNLTYGIGLKRLYAMTCGVGTLNDSDIAAITTKAEAMKLIPHRLTDFMHQCVFNNMALYGKALQTMITDRIVRIARGDVVNPSPTFKFSADEARRFFYLPPPTFLARVQKALDEDRGAAKSLRGNPCVSIPAVSLVDVGVDADLLLSRMQITEGHIAPVSSAWSALVAIVENLVYNLESEARYYNPGNDVKAVALPCLKILWVVAKFLMADLTIQPLHKNLNQIDLTQKLNFADGTLAAIPFPLQQSLALFSDDDVLGISMKGRMYLSAVSLAAFYRPQTKNGGGGL